MKIELKMNNEALYKTCEATQDGTLKKEFNMLKVFCYKCRKELVEPGALIFSSPGYAGMILKFHICKECEKDLMAWIRKPELS